MKGVVEDGLHLLYAVEHFENSFLWQLETELGPAVARLHLAAGDEGNDNLGFALGAGFRENRHESEIWHGATFGT